MYNISTYYIIKVEGMKSVDKTITMPDNYKNIHHMYNVHNFI